jgi:cytidylate kinase
MNTTIGLDECLSFINCQLQSPHWARSGEAGYVRCVTVSRQSGCGAHVFAEELAAWLREHVIDDPAPWTVFDRSLVEAVLRDHHLPSRLAAFMPEDRVSQLDDIIHDLLSLHPPTELLVRQTSETILHLAELGHVIILGRGGNLIPARLPQALHVRLVGSLEQRVAHMKNFDKLSRKEAFARIRREDGGRRRYLKRYFRKDIDDSLQYHLVINTDLLALKEAAAMFGGLVVSHTVPETKPPVTVPAGNS